MTGQTGCAPAQHVATRHPTLEVPVREHPPLQTRTEIVARWPVGMAVHEGACAGLPERDFNGAVVDIGPQRRVGQAALARLPPH